MGTKNLSATMIELNDEALATVMGGDGNGYGGGQGNCDGTGWGQGGCGDNNWGQGGHWNNNGPLGLVGLNGLTNTLGLLNNLGLPLGL